MKDMTEGRKRGCKDGRLEGEWFTVKEERKKEKKRMKGFMDY